VSDYNLQQLVNSNFNAVRQLRADHDDLKARVDTLVTTMNEFKNRAEALLIEMSQAHKPQESTTNGK
jgi:chaperonin cofactor prefoldin